MAPRLESFGRATPGANRSIGIAEVLAAPPGAMTRWQSMLPYGNGRSYGDSCQAASGTVIDMRGANRILAFDAATGVLEAEAGAMLPDVIAHAAPQGWFPAVVPGTQFVTLGGAVANDIHGKNHHRRGTFGCHVESFRLLRSDGTTYHCTPTQNADLFAATIGGMGLTGIILTVTLRLLRVPSLDIAEQVTPFAGLSEYFDLAEAADEANEYAVAWIDQLATGKAEGRGLLMTGNHAEAGARAASPAGGLLSVPLQPPFNVLNRPFLTLFNKAYHWRKGSGSRARKSGYQGFFFPLDGVRNWNRLYGPKGLFQHQSVVPFDAARAIVPKLLAAARDAGQGSFLTVLKRFGSVPSPGIVSFPRPGYTLTLDFPNGGARTLALLSQLDDIVIDAGGAINPYKDARMSPKTFARSFPDWGRLETRRDPAFLSAFWQRTALRLASHDGRMARAAA
ncbi:MAG: FAD-dependent oxidoreductase [Rhizobiaceae bacterium]